MAWVSSVTIASIRSVSANLGSTLLPKAAASSVCSRAVASPSSRARPEKSGSGPCWPTPCWPTPCRLAVASDQPSLELGKKTDKMASTPGSALCPSTGGACTVIGGRAGGERANTGSGEFGRQLGPEAGEYLIADSVLVNPDISQQMPQLGVARCQLDVGSYLDLAHPGPAASEPALGREPFRQQISQHALRHQTSQASRTGRARPCG